MSEPLPILRFEPIFKTMLWGGQRLRPWLGRTPSAEPTGEAWILSDVDGSESRVSGGPHAGRSLRELMASERKGLLGNVQASNGRFPLLLKFIDAKHELSVQVHPTDDQARARDPRAAGKTEAWVILDANPKTSRIYAGFRSGVNVDELRASTTAGRAETALHQFNPRAGDCVFLPAGTVHAIGADILLFEVQQTSDITYRLSDWNRVDAKSGKPRELHIDQGLACSDFTKGPCDPVKPVHEGEIETLVDCNYFELRRLTIERPFEIGTSNGECRIVVVIEGLGNLDAEDLKPGDTLLIPASAMPQSIVPRNRLTILLCAPRAAC